MEITLIIPAHNEELRLEQTLSIYTPALEQVFGRDYEVIVVANACRDNTVAVAERASRSLPAVRVLDIPERVGKGGAVLAGMDMAQGARVLFADADAATAPDSLLQLAAALDGVDIAIGSRRMPESEIAVSQPWRRRLLGSLFASTVRTLFAMPFRDTQCGAKAFRLAAARRLVPLVHERFWAFDVDLLLCAREQGFSIAEVPVQWSDQQGSRLQVAATAREVGTALLRLKRRHASLQPAKPHWAVER